MEQLVLQTEIHTHAIVLNFTQEAIVELVNKQNIPIFYDYF